MTKTHKLHCLYYILTFGSRTKRRLCSFTQPLLSQHSRGGGSELSWKTFFWNRNRVESWKSGIWVSSLSSRPCFIPNELFTSPLRSCHYPLSYCGTLNSAPRHFFHRLQITWDWTIIWFSPCLKNNSLLWLFRHRAENKLGGILHTGPLNRLPMIFFSCLVENKWVRKCVKVNTHSCWNIPQTRGPIEEVWSLQSEDLSAFLCCYRNRQDYRYMVSVQKPFRTDWYDYLWFVTFFLSCLVTRPGVFEGVFSQSLMGTGCLRSIWLTWKQLCFPRSDWGFIVTRSELGFTGTNWLNNVKSHVSASVTVAQKPLWLFLVSSSADMN